MPTSQLHGLPKASTVSPSLPKPPQVSQSLRKPSKASQRLPKPPFSLLIFIQVNSQTALLLNHKCEAFHLPVDARKSSRFVRHMNYKKHNQELEHPVSIKTDDSRLYEALKVDKNVVRIDGPVECSPVQSNAACLTQSGSIWPRILISSVHDSGCQKFKQVLSNSKL